MKYIICYFLLCFIIGMADFAEVWYATSKDGWDWKEQGLAVGRGPQGAYNDRAVFTPEVLAHNGKYYLVYQVVKAPYVNRVKNNVGMAIAEAPDGPWGKFDAPILKPTDNGQWLGDAFGNLELIYRDNSISSMNPIPVRPRKKPLAQPAQTDWDGPQEGCFLVQDIYKGLKGVEHGVVKSLRIVGVPPKTQPYMDSPSLGVSKEDPGKFVLGTVPVEEDGSAYFLVPSGVSVFFQALDGDGLALQTMRSLTYVQPGQTLSCVGCHESRELAPGVAKRPLAARREASRLIPGPAGSWPLRFDALVQPVLDKSCVSCHSPGSNDKHAAQFDLTAKNSYQSLMSFAEKDLEKLAFERDASIVGQSPAMHSKLLALLRHPDGHRGVHLDDDSFERLAT